MKNEKMNFKIIHLAQIHYTPGMEASLELLLLLAQCQFNIAKEILRRPNIPVVSEGSTASLPAENDDNIRELIELVKIIFPSGFPLLFAQLTQQQQLFLAVQGAAVTLFLIGAIPAVYKAVSKEEKHIIDEKFATAGDYKVTMIPSEIAVMKWTKIAAINHFKKLQGSTVIVVFGRDHDFTKDSKHENFDLERIDVVAQEIPALEKCLANCPPETVRRMAARILIAAPKPALNVVVVKDIGFQLREASNDKNPVCDAFKKLLTQAQEQKAINSTGKNTGMTALHFAAQQGNVDKINLLLAGGASKNHSDSKGRTAYDIAKTNYPNNQKLLDILMLPKHDEKHAPPAKQSSFFELFRCRRKNTLTEESANNQLNTCNIQ